jgi:hypothetical protein
MRRFVVLPPLYELRVYQLDEAWVRRSRAAGSGVRPVGWPILWRQVRERRFRDEFRQNRVAGAHAGTCSARDMIRIDPYGHEPSRERRSDAVLRLYQPAEPSTVRRRHFRVMADRRVKRPGPGSGPPSTSLTSRKKDVDTDLRRHDGVAPPKARSQRGFAVHLRGTIHPAARDSGRIHRRPER